MNRTCRHCNTASDGHRCRYCGGLMDELVRDDHAAALVPHAVEGVAWWTPFLSWQRREFYRRVHLRGED